jgi:methionine synthase II (cobalamin-independent)
MEGGNRYRRASPNTQLVIGDCLVHKKRIAKNEADFLRKYAPGPFKIALLSPINFAVVFWRRGRSETAYASPSEFLAHAAKILADEAKALSDEGVPYIQL